MAERGRGARKDKDSQHKRPCPMCEESTRVVQYAGFGSKKGFYWACESKSCDYAARTR